MYQLINNQQPTSKLSGTISTTYQGKTYHIKHTATRSIESSNLYIDDALVGQVYVRQTLLKDLQITSEVVQVTGEYIPFLAVLGYAEDVNKMWVGAVYQPDKLPNGTPRKLKDAAYLKLEVGGGKGLANLGAYKTVEDFIYRTKSLTATAKELGLNLDWSKKKDYRILRTRAEIEEFVKGLAEYVIDETHKLPIGFDTETTGLHVNHSHADKLVGISMSYKLDSGVYFPIAQERMPNMEISEEELLAMLKPYCDFYSDRKKRLLAHNGRFDWRVMKTVGWNLNLTDDTFVRESLMDIGGSQRILGLKGITKMYLHRDVIELSDLYDYPSWEEIVRVRTAINQGLIPCNEITKRKLNAANRARDLMDFRYAPESFVALYGPADADFPREIYQLRQPEWDKYNKSMDFIYSLEMALTRPLGEQEYYGVSVQKAEFERLHAETALKMDELAESIYHEAGATFKIGGKDTAHYVYDVCGVPYNPKFKTKKGDRSVDSKATDYYAQYTNPDGSPLYPIIMYLKKYNKLKTLQASFYSKLPTLVVDGRIYPTYQSLKAETGRLTCSGPNVQQTEPTSREFMGPESDDYYIYGSDYSQIEYRINAGVSHEKNVVNFYTRDPEADFHVMAYAMMYGVPPAKVDSKQRKVGKKLNFANNYGLGLKSLAVTLFGNDTPASVAKAKEMQATYFKGIPNIKAHTDYLKDRAQETHVSHTLFNRQRRITQFDKAAKETNPRSKAALIEKGRKLASNTPIQGTGADLLKIAMVRCYKTIHEKYGLTDDDMHMILNVHDEIEFQVSKRIHPYMVVKIVREAMEWDYVRSLGLPPLYTGGAVGRNWMECHSDENEAPVRLMDRMVAAADKAIATGVPLPYCDDPAKLWHEDIVKYTLEVIDSQYHLGYENVDKDLDNPADKDKPSYFPIHNLAEALGSGRIAKYAEYFEEKGPYLVGMVMQHGFEDVYAHLDDLLTDDTHVIAELNRLGAKYQGQFAAATQDLEFRTYCEYWNIPNTKIEFPATIMQALCGGMQLKALTYIKPATKLEKDQYQVTLADNSTVMLTANATFTPVTDTIGKEVAPSELTIEEQVRQFVKYDADTLYFTFGDIDPSVVQQFMDNFLLPTVAAHSFFSKEPCFKVQTRYNADAPYSYHPSKLIPQSIARPIKEFFIKIITGESTDSLFTEFQAQYIAPHIK